MRFGLDLVVRLMLKAAYVAARGWWFVRRPRTAGALVALWHGHRLLVIRTSYRPHVSLPGGFVSAGEAPRDAAVRELREELDLSVDAGALREAWCDTIDFEHRQDTVTIFEASVPDRPEIRLDRREIVWADWIDAERARALQLLPHLRRYLERASPATTPTTAREDRGPAR
jgi:8-oxo-dGTP diphosphatase